MASTAVGLLGSFPGLLGFAGAIAATLLPQWRSSAHVGANILTASGSMMGLWMECLWHSTGIYQCTLYRSLLTLPHDLQVARALIVLSCMTSVLACLLSVTGPFSFFCTGVFCLVTVAWTTRDIIFDFYPFFNGLKHDIGLAVYLGYASAFRLMAALLLCWSSRSDMSHSTVHKQINKLSSPPPAFNHIYPPAPPYKPPEALRDNHAPSLCSICRSGYRISE